MQSQCRINNLATPLLPTPHSNQLQGPFVSDLLVGYHAAFVGKLPAGVSHGSRAVYGLF